MITKQNLTCKLKLRGPEIETGHVLKSGALFYNFDSKAALGALHTIIQEIGQESKKSR